jgi:hypothetical protein
MAVSIFTTHLFGDIWSPMIGGWLADPFGGSLQKTILILPVAWLAAALRLLRALKRKPGRAHPAVAA